MNSFDILLGGSGARLHFPRLQATKGWFWIFWGVGCQWCSATGEVFFIPSLVIRKYRGEEKQVMGLIEYMREAPALVISLGACSTEDMPRTGSGEEG